MAAARHAIWALCLAIVVWLLQSALWTARIPLPLRALVAGTAALSAVRPAFGLLLVAALAPLGNVLTNRIWQSHPFAFSEALVLAFFAGYFWAERRRLVRPPDAPDPVLLPARLFTLVVVASGAVQFVVLQVWHDYPLPYAASFLQYLRTGYLTSVPDPRAWVDGRGFVSVAALLLEGVGLLRCARQLCARQPAMRRALAMTLAAAGAVGAALSFQAPLSGARSLRQVLRRLRIRRWSSPAVPSLDTAGPYFMLLAFLAAGVAIESRAYLLPGALAAIVLFAGMWLTKTRSAIVAALAVLTAVAAWRAGTRLGVLSRTRVFVAAGIASIAVGVALVVFNPLHVLAATGKDVAIRMRVLFAETGLRMFATAPWTGVGIGQYESQYLEFAPPELLHYDKRVNNAHDYFLWLAAELGAVGFATFMWMIVAAFRDSLTNLRRAPAGTRAALAGLFAFLITWSIGQPLGVPPVAYAFWLALGAATAFGVEAREAPAAGASRAWPSRLAAAAIVLVVVAGVPLKARHDVSEIDMSRVSYGFHGYARSADDRVFQWAGPHAVFFLRASVQEVDVPIAALQPAMPAAQVALRVNGRSAARVAIADRAWHVVTLPRPSDVTAADPYWRVDLEVTPTAPGPREAEPLVAMAALVRK